jgi:hypothetical protein
MALDEPSTGVLTDGRREIGADPIQVRIAQASAASSLISFGLVTWGFRWRAWRDSNPRPGAWKVVPRWAVVKRHVD